MVYAASQKEMKSQCCIGSCKQHDKNKLHKGRKRSTRLDLLYSTATVQVRDKFWQQKGPREEWGGGGTPDSSANPTFDRRMRQMSGCLPYEKEGKGRGI